MATSTFRYFRHIRVLFLQHSISTAEICKYMSKLESAFATRFGDFQKYGPMFFPGQERKLWWRWIGFISNRLVGCTGHGYNLVSISDICSKCNMLSIISNWKAHCHPVDIICITHWMKYGEYGHPKMGLTKISNLMAKNGRPVTMHINVDIAP